MLPPDLLVCADFIDKEEEARKSPNRVLYFRRNADYDRLIEVCSRKLSENPRNIRALLIRASSNLKKGESCLATCGSGLPSQQLPALAPHRQTNRRRRRYSSPGAPAAPTVAAAGTLEPSLEDYNTVLQLEPGNVDALYYRGTVYEKLGRLDEAISDFTAVLTLDPNHIKASYARGACRNLKGDFQKAIGETGARLPSSVAAAEQSASVALGVESQPRQLHT